MNIARISGQPLYDTYRHTGAAFSTQTIRLFTNSVGKNADGFTAAPFKTLAETNLTSQGLAQGTAYTVEKIGVYCRVAGAAAPAVPLVPIETYQDISAILRNCVLSFVQGSDDQILGPAEFFPAGAGLVGANVGTGSGADFAGASVVNGSSNQQGMYRLPEPIVLQDGTTFSFNLRLTRDLVIQDAAANYDISVLLWGTQFQRIQP
jgi:hypothetical protein